MFMRLAPALVAAMAAAACVGSVTTVDCEHGACDAGLDDDASSGSPDAPGPAFDTGTPADASSLDAGAPGEPVWPGTQTRYYPGIYPLLAHRVAAADFDPGWVQQHFDAWFNGREDQYKEFVGTTPVTHLGISVFVEPSRFFSSYWRTSSLAPYDWQGSCARVSEAQSPDAAPGGHPLYDWEWWDSLLSQPFLAQGKGKVILKVQETYARDVPEWMLADGYAKDADWYYTQMQDWAVVYMWQDIMTAFATRYQGDPRIASINFDETYPDHWEKEVLCGNVHGLAADSEAANSGLMELMDAYLQVDPGMLTAIVNWYPGRSPADTYWEGGYGGASLGADDLPGVQGHWIQDMYFFAVGSGAPCTEDSTDVIWLNASLAQHAAVNHTGPVFVSSEAYGWFLPNTSRRLGADNPWNVSAWPAAGGVLPNDDGSLFPSPRFFTWYTSGAPRAGGAAADSGLGQVGADPCGVIPADFYVMYVPDWAPGDRPGWTSDNLSITRWLEAFDTFGPQGTKAMFNFPPGYLEQFR